MLRGGDEMVGTCGSSFFIAFIVPVESSKNEGEGRLPRWEEITKVS